MAANIEKRNLVKSKKYAPFVRDITGMTCAVNCFDVSSTKFISTRNKSTLTTLHSFIRKDMKKFTFLSSLNSLAWYGSYKIWLTRDKPAFADPPLLIPDLTT